MDEKITIGVYKSVFHKQLPFQKKSIDEKPNNR